MMDFWEARTARYKRNQEAILKLVKEVLEADSEIEAYVHKGDKVISNVVFFKGEDRNSVSFHEVPYRWSGCGYKEHQVANNEPGTNEFPYSHRGLENNAMPFEVNDVLTTFKPISKILLRQPNEYFQSKEQYLKWCSWLKIIEL